MFKRILIANRGEIACRVIRTCDRLGIESVAVYSDADINAQHVRQADLALHIGGARPAESYLCIDKIIDAARASGAQAIHPGYGFLSENANLVRACDKAGIAFVGPDIKAVEQMGSKADAKAIMSAAGVPLVPGYHGEEQTDQILSEQAGKIGFPLMIKAAAGGGGKGMRIVKKAEDFPGALAAARREASNAFGDEQMILEKYLLNPRHIEFQVFGDNQGTVIHLNERECSIQRRYQKVLEESPSPFLNPQLRNEMGAAAVAAAKAVDYRGAGTVEFIVEQDGRFYFMEMNTRLQVEHPVTECVTGIDLVEWQLRVAAGEPLPATQQDIHSKGHAIEARVYAESPEQGFLPSSGRLNTLEFPQHLPGIRVDSGVQQGDVISIYYDPMIAKVIAWGNDRDQAIVRLANALSLVRISGPQSNVPFLYQLLHQSEVTSGEMSTSWLDQAVEEIVEPASQLPASVLVAASVARLLSQEAQAEGPDQTSQNDPYSPWAVADAWRLGHPGRRVLEFVCDKQVVDISAHGFAGSYRLSWSGTGQEKDIQHDLKVECAQRNEHEVRYEIQGQQMRVNLVEVEDRLMIAVSGRIWPLAMRDPFAFDPTTGGSDDALAAPMPGRVVCFNVNSGDQVSAGQELLVLEAMKMEISLKAPHDGIVGPLNHQAGDFVEADTVLITIEKQSTDSA